MLDSLSLEVLANDISFQAEQGNIATESLNFTLELTATKKSKHWQWKHKTIIPQGEIYKAPVYIAIKKEKSISIQTQGIWNPKGSIVIQQANLKIPNIINLKADGVIKQKPEVTVRSANIQSDILDLGYFSKNYLSSLFEQTALEGISFKGQLSSKIKFSNSTLKQIHSTFTHLSINDLKKRIELTNSQGTLNWSSDPLFNIPSSIHWDKLKVKTIPFKTGQLNLLLSQKKIVLSKKSSIPVLGGAFMINQFKWQHHSGTDPSVYFEGKINNVSLEQLSQALDWPLLTGNISGYIPGVEYKNKVLKVNGELNINIFDGIISINQLKSSGLLTDYPKLNMDIKIDNLDLHALTQKLETGDITGRISGFVNDLYLENWSPITFFAWLGTPEDDDSRHRISQRAVKSITSIGGNSPSDIISRSILNFFDTFGYSSLGFGCYLHEGVCQVMGVGAAKQGYYIIKGGGIPRIDIIGHNPHIDWNIFLKRLSRISNSSGS